MLEVYFVRFEVLALGEVVCSEKIRMPIREFSTMFFINFSFVPLFKVKAIISEY